MQTKNGRLAQSFLHMLPCNEPLPISSVVCMYGHVYTQYIYNVYICVYNML